MDILTLAAMLAGLVLLIVGAEALVKVAVLPSAKEAGRRAGRRR